MKVFSIERDYSYQYFLPEGNTATTPNSLGLPMPVGWTPPPFYILEPNLKRGNFVHWVSCVMICDRTVRDTLQDMLEMSGELFEFFYKNEEFVLLNPLSVLAVLDENKSIWRRHYKTGEKTEVIEKYVFHPERFCEVPIFKIPEDRVTLFTVEGMKHPEDEFKHRVEHFDLKGITFTAVWSDDPLD
jgi:hypothetical protein